MSDKSLSSAKKRKGFRFYFLLFVSIVLFISVPTADYLSEITSKTINASDGVMMFLNYVFMAAYALIIGVLLSYFISRALTEPINKLQQAMNTVAEGNLNVAEMGDNRINEINDLNHAFNVMMQELRSTETIQTDFVTNVSHEFKTPFYAIEGYATLLQDDNITAEEKREYIEKILFSLRKANQLIGNVLLLSKVDNQAIVSPKQKFSLDEQIRQSIVMAEPKWSEKNIDFDVDMDSITYNGNEAMMFHVWSNLIGNAIKFNPIGGMIKIRLTEENGIIVFTIEDRGPGIAENSQKKVFDKFYQGDTSHKEEGNGLGLALVKKILDLYGGTIAVQNVTPAGCVFTVKLRQS